MIFLTESIFMKFQYIFLLYFNIFFIHGTALHIAVKKQNESIIELLLSHKDIDVTTPDNILSYFFL